MKHSRLILMTLALLAFSGCAIQNRLFPPAPFSNRAPSVLPPDASKEHIVQHINRNILGSESQAGLKSWYSTSVKLSSHELPIPVPAKIAVEAPHHFRLRVSDPIGGSEQVDVGSNEEHYWFWAKGSKNVILASHDDLPMAQQLTKVPFHPDWLMEVMGVVPIDATGMTLSRSNPNSPIVELVQEIPSPNGETISKVVRVNSCHGIVVEHALYKHNRLIASARLGNHRIDEATGIVTPRTIRLDWPDMQQHFTMEFHDMWINHVQPPQAWQVPEKHDCPPIEFRQLLSQAHGSGFTPFGVPPQGRPNESDVNPFADAEPNGSHPSQPVIAPMSASGQQPVYSEAASQSSSVPPRRARGLWRLPWQRPR